MTYTTHLKLLTFAVMAKMILLIIKAFLMTCLLLSVVVESQADSSKWFEFLSKLSSNTGGKDLKLKAKVDNIVPDQVSNDQIDLDYVMNTEGSVPTPKAYCAEESATNLKYYCNGLHDGQYFDPWNPYCGYIECMDQAPQRRICTKGTWMGSEYAMKGQDYMCRRGLTETMKQVTPGDQCSMKTDLLALCQNAHVVEAMNAMM